MLSLPSAGVYRIWTLLQTNLKLPPNGNQALLHPARSCGEGEGTGREIEKKRHTDLTVSREIPLGKTLLNQAVIRSISRAVCCVGYNAAFSTKALKRSALITSATKILLLSNQPCGISFFKKIVVFHFVF